MSETEPTPDFTSMRQVDFARERAAMCTADITDLAATLGSMRFPSGRR